MSHARPLYPGYVPGTSMAPGCYATSMWQVAKVSFKVGARKLAYAVVLLKSGRFGAKPVCVFPVHHLKITHTAPAVSVNPAATFHLSGSTGCPGMFAGRSFPALLRSWANHQMMSENS